MPDITFTENAFAEYLGWQNDKQTMKRVNLLLRDIIRTPFEGIGKPEPLKGDLSGWWSRRIDEANRIVYRIARDELELLQCGGHYRD